MTLRQAFDVSSAERSGLRAVDLASFVPDYSGVAVPDSHGVPFSALGHLNTEWLIHFYYHKFQGKVKLICSSWEDAQRDRWPHSYDPTDQVSSSPKVVL